MAMKASKAARVSAAHDAAIYLRHRPTVVLASDHAIPSRLDIWASHGPGGTPDRLDQPYGGAQSLRRNRHEAQLVKLREDMNKLREDMNRLREDMNRGFELLRRHIDALGARWGLLAEESFRAGS